VLPGEISILAGHPHARREALADRISAAQFAQ
jgi:hypothetical protein